MLLCTEIVMIASVTTQNSRDEMILCTKYTRCSLLLKWFSGLYMLLSLLMFVHFSCVHFLSRPIFVVLWDLQSGKAKYSGIGWEM